MMAQFNCSVCGDEFEQKSRLLRHIETSHPLQAPSAADIEKVLGGIDYPKTKDDPVQYSSQKVPKISNALLNLIKSLPSRRYRDSAEVAIALGELKSGKKIRDAAEVEASVQPSTKGGSISATASISEAAIASVLRGIRFPKTRDSLRDYAKKNISKINSQKFNEILNMPDVEKSVGNLI